MSNLERPQLPVQDIAIPLNDEEEVLFTLGGMRAGILSAVAPTLGATSQGIAQKDLMEQTGTTNLQNHTASLNRLLRPYGLIIRQQIEDDGVNTYLKLHTIPASNSKAPQIEVGAPAQNIDDQDIEVSQPRFVPPSWVFRRMNPAREQEENGSVDKPEVPTPEEPTVDKELHEGVPAEVERVTLEPEGIPAEADEPTAQQTPQIPEDLYREILKELSPKQRDALSIVTMYAVEGQPLSRHMLAEIMYAELKRPLDNKISNLNVVLSKLNDRLATHGYAISRRPTMAGKWTFIFLPLAHAKEPFTMKEPRQWRREGTERLQQPLPQGFVPANDEDSDVRFVEPAATYDNFTDPESLNGDSKALSREYQKLKGSKRTGIDYAQKLWNLRERALLSLMSATPDDLPAIHTILGGNRDQVIKSVRDLLTQAMLNIHHGKLATPNQHVLRSYLLSESGRAMLVKLYEVK